MITVTELRAHLERLSYKPGWNFEVYEGEFEGPHIRTHLLDTYEEGEIDLGIHSMLPPMPSLDYFERWLAWRLTRNRGSRDARVPEARRPGDLRPARGGGRGGPSPGRFLAL